MKGNNNRAQQFQAWRPSYSETPLLPRKNLCVKVDIANVSLQACKYHEAVKYIMETALASGSAYQTFLREARAPHKFIIGGFVARRQDRLM